MHKFAVLALCCIAAVAFAARVEAGAPGETKDSWLEDEWCHTKLQAAGVTDQEGSEYGHAVALSGAVAAVGSPAHRRRPTEEYPDGAETGFVFVFTRQVRGVGDRRVGPWTQDAVLRADDFSAAPSSPADRFGFAISLTATDTETPPTLAVGSPGFAAGGLTNAGRAVIFYREAVEGDRGAFEWRQVVKIEQRVGQANAECVVGWGRGRWLGTERGAIWPCAKNGGSPRRGRRDNATAPNEGDAARSE